MRKSCILLALLLLIGAAQAEKVSEQEKLQSIQKELQQSKEKLKATKVQQQQVLGKLVVINQELKQADNKLNRANKKVKENETKIGELTVDLRKSEDDLEKKSTLLERRVREAYKNGRTNYLDLILASHSMSDFLNRYYYFEKIIGRDTSLIKDVKEDLQTTKTQRAILKDKTSEIKELTVVIQEQKEKISQQAAEKKKALEELKARETEYEKQIEELEKSSRELEVMIQKKMAERQKAGIKATGSGTYIWPLHGRLTSPYGVYRRRMRGRRHTGIDIAAPYGTPVVAADAGEVIFSGWWDGYGKAIVIDHGRGKATVYAHFSRLIPSVGATVAKGQTIGLVGSTGYSTGPHLHFEVRKNGTPINPMQFLPK